MNIELNDVDKDSFDKKVGINKYVNPSVGSGYAISSGGESYSIAERTWNFHWGGVVMESDDTKDKVILENYGLTGDWNAENKNWELQMYGTQKKGQTFHERHEETKEHGKSPITMNIKKS